LGWRYLLPGACPLGHRGPPRLTCRLAHLVSELHGGQLPDCPRRHHAPSPAQPTMEPASLAGHRPRSRLRSENFPPVVESAAPIGPRECHARGSSRQPWMSRLMSSMLLYAACRGSNQDHPVELATPLVGKQAWLPLLWSLHEPRASSGGNISL
jgi:hypothetical protein